jgi:hypothetical protein
MVSMDPEKEPHELLGYNKSPFLCKLSILPPVSASFLLPFRSETIKRNHYLST